MARAPIHKLCIGRRITLNPDSGRTGRVAGAAESSPSQLSLCNPTAPQQRLPVVESSVTGSFSYALIGCARASKADGSQSLGLQRDTLGASGVDAVNICLVFQETTREGK